jgi:hypothetical protein
MIRKRLVVSMVSTALALSVAAMGCHRDTPSPAGGPPPPAPTGTAPSPALDPTAAARQVVQAWNDALNRHDVAAMAGLYDERVRFYGREASKASVLKAKQGAFGTASTFTQQIEGPITIAPGSGGELVATFLKRSGSAGKLHEVHAKLALRAADGGLPMITEETDEVSAQRGEDAGAPDCETMAAHVVNALTEVKREVADLKKTADESGSSSHFGGFGPIYEGDSKFSAGIGLYTDQRFQGEINYTVDHGHLYVDILGTNVSVPISAQKVIEHACSQ